MCIDCGDCVYHCEIIIKNKIINSYINTEYDAWCILLCGIYVYKEII